MMDSILVGSSSSGSSSQRAYATTKGSKSSVDAVGNECKESRKAKKARDHKRKKNKRKKEKKKEKKRKREDDDYMQRVQILEDEVELASSSNASMPMRFSHELRYNPKNARSDSHSQKISPRQELQILSRIQEKRTDQLIQTHVENVEGSSEQEDDSRLLISPSTFEYLTSGIAFVSLSREGDNRVQKLLQLSDHLKLSTKHNSHSSYLECSSVSHLNSHATIPPKANTNEKMQNVRAALGVAQHRDRFLELLYEHQVVVVEGDTGCGKTTQLPQYILEVSTSRGKKCNIVVTQPRRISAVSVAERVAEERGERCGSTIGYAIRMETQASECTCLLFCTVGVMLRRLESDPDLHGLTHIFVDEVHERSVESDLLLLALAQVRHRRTDLKIILMSATIDGNLLAAYFGAPKLEIPGRLFPIKTLFLEDALALTEHVIDSYADWALRPALTKRRYIRRAEFSGRQQSKSIDDACALEDFSLPEVKRRYSHHSADVQEALAALDQSVVNYELVAQIVKHVISKPPLADANGSELGAILIFLAGAKEIQTMRSTLFTVVPCLAKDPACSWVLTLHSSIPAEEQRMAFARPPRGIRKVLLATNIAETSITIDDVGVVIDTGHVKELRYDITKRVSSLEDVIVSRATAKQRRGRAGRVAAGTCFHLITKFCHDHILQSHQQAEVFRVPLEQLVLRIHSAGIHLHTNGSAIPACKKLPEPPDAKSVRQSVEELIELGAMVKDIDDNENLTLLGRSLSSLPLDARLGKFVLLSIPFGDIVLDAALTIASVLTLGSPFYSPFERRFQATRAHRHFGEEMVFGSLSCSDALAALQAFCEWDEYDKKGQRAFCGDNFLRASVLLDVARMRNELLETLKSNRFVDSRHWLHYSLPTRKRSKAYQRVAPNIIALLCAAMFPKLAVVVPKKTLLSEVAKSSQVCPVDILVCDAGSKSEVESVQIHPSSLSAREKLFGTPYLVYHKMIRTGRLQLHDITPVPPLTLLMFSGFLSNSHKIRIARQKHGIAIAEITDQVKIAMHTSTLEHIVEIRRRMEHAWKNIVEQRITTLSQKEMPSLLNTDFYEILLELLQTTTSCKDFVR